MILNNITKELWIKLDTGLSKIEAEWENRMLIEKYSKEFIKQSYRKINDVDELTVEEIQCWFRLLNVNIDNKYGDLYFKHMNDYGSCNIYITYWVWFNNKKQHLIIDISFEIINNNYKEKYGAIFLHDYMIMINNKNCLYKTNKTPIELEKRIPTLEALRK